MPAVNVMIEMTVDKLLNAVADLDEEGLAVFEAGFEQIWLQRNGSIDTMAAQMVEKHRLPPRSTGTCMRIIVEKSGRRFDSA